MQNQEMNMMQFRKRWYDEGLQIKVICTFLCPTAVKIMEKDRKLNNIYFSSVYEEGKSPRTL